MYPWQGDYLIGKYEKQVERPLRVAIPSYPAEPQWLGTTIPAGAIRCHDARGGPS